MLFSKMYILFHTSAFDDDMNLNEISNIFPSFKNSLLDLKKQNRKNTSDISYIVII